MVTIKGIIGDEKSHYGLVNLISDIKKEPENQPLHILIDSPGGLANMALDMHKYIRSLKRFVVTECVNQCFSAATILFLAGDKRIAGCPLMIHNPWITVDGDAETLARASKYIEKTEKELETFYSENTKLSENVLSDLMKNETYITPQKAVELGFATEAKAQALALFNNKNINKIPTKMAKEDTKFIKAIKAFAAAFGDDDGGNGDNKPKALELATTTDVVLIVDREEGEPQVGDVATPDGEHTLPDGVVIVVADGVITEIRPAAPSEIENLQKENAALKSEIENLKTSVKTNDEKAILNAVKIAGGSDWLAKNCSHYKVQGRVNNFNKELDHNGKVQAKLEVAREKKKKALNA